MALKIRLRQQGCTNNIVYRVVVADSRSPRDGKFVESIGWYNPKAKDKTQECSMLPDRLQHWLHKGAELTSTVEALVKQSAPEILLGFKQMKMASKTKRATKNK